MKFLLSLRSKPLTLLLPLANLGSIQAPQILMMMKPLRNSL